MRLVPGDAGAQKLDALMGVGDAHLAGLADDRETRPRHTLRQRADQPRHAEAADFLVIAQRQMQRSCERPRQSVAAPSASASAMNPFMSAVPRP